LTAQLEGSEEPKRLQGNPGPKPAKKKEASRAAGI